VIKYFGEVAINAKECEIAYNATLMALLWEAVATKNATLLNRAIRSIPDKLERATWLNYVRCHDDIGLGFDDNDIRLAGYEPALHRQFLLHYYTDRSANSSAKGIAFGTNVKNGDARIAGSLASLAGLETALEHNDDDAITRSIDTILLLHGLILAFGGIPLIYYGDAIGTLNDQAYLEDDYKKNDNRWIHRPAMDWSKSELRAEKGTTQQRIFSGLKKMIATRKEITAFADHNNRELISLDNPHLFCFVRTHGTGNHPRVLVICNFDHKEQVCNIDGLRKLGLLQAVAVKNLFSDDTIDLSSATLSIPPLGMFWLET